MSTSQPPSLVKHNYVKRHLRNDFIRILESLLKSAKEKMDKKEKESVKSYIKMLELPTSRLKYISVADRTQIDKLVAKFWEEDIPDSAPSSPNSAEDEDDTVPISLSVPKHCVSSLIISFENLYINQPEKFEFLRDAIDKIKKHAPQISVSELLSRVRDELEEIPHQDTWLRVFQERVGRDVRFQSSLDTVVPLFYAETLKLRQALNAEDFTSQDAIAIREIVAWVYDNVPEVDDEVAEYENGSSPYHTVEVDIKELT